MADTVDESTGVSRYDTILAGVPLTTLMAYVGAAALFDGPLLAQLTALAAGSAVIADGLFVHSPADS